jgi:hypothetical protein
MVTAAGLWARVPEGEIQVSYVGKRVKAPETKLLGNAAHLPRMMCATIDPLKRGSDDGRGGFRTCDLSRVKRALSH